MFPIYKHWNDLLFSGSRLERGKTRCGGGREASHEDTWQSRSAETHGDVLALTPTPQRVQETSPGGDKVILGGRRKLQRARGYWEVVHMLSLFGRIRSHLEVIDVILCVQVNAHGFLLDWHDREANIDAAMKLSLLQLRRETPMLPSLHVSGCKNESLCSCGDTYISCPLGILQNAFLQHKVSLGGKKSHAVNMCASESSFLSSPSSNMFIAPFGYTRVKHHSKKVQTVCGFAAMTPYSLDPAIQLLKQQQEKECSAVMDNSHV